MATRARGREREPALLKQQRGQTARGVTTYVTDSIVTGGLRQGLKELPPIVATQTSGTLRSSFHHAKREPIDGR